MSEKKHRVHALLKVVFNRYVKGKTTAEERRLVEDFYENVIGSDPMPEDMNRIGREMKTAIDESTRGAWPSYVRKRPMLIGAAACFVFFIISVIRFMHDDVGKMPVQPAANVAAEDPILFLDENRTYNLADALPSGAFYRGINDEKVLDVSLLGKEEPSGRVRIENPARRVFSVLLADGSQLWLNRYAAIEFDAGERMVYVSGEVFFDIKSVMRENRKVPFVVKTALQTIEVLGTQFNVDATRRDEENVELLEGSIRLTHNVRKTALLMAPGQQAFLKTDEPRIFVVNAKDGEKANAWRKGLFYFDNETLATVRDELVAWYGVELIISPEIVDLPITAMISRYDDINEVLQMIELTNNITYVKKKGKVYVRKKD